MPVETKNKSLDSNIPNIPLDLVLDTINLAAESVSVLLNKKLEVPPVFIESLKTKDKTTKELDGSENPMHPINIINVAEIWKVFLDRTEDLSYVYVVITAKYTITGINKGTWSDIKYKGFYGTDDEAKNEINCYL